MNAMMKAMAKEQNELRERVEAERVQAHQHMPQLTQMILEMKEEA